MPNVSAHIGCALKVKERLNITDDRFIYGSLLPDILDMDKRKSHYKKRGTFFLVPDLDYYKDNNDLKDPFILGYYLHLYLDYYYLEEYLEQNNKGIDVFSDSTLYRDYDIINKDLVEHFNIDANEIEKILRNNSNNEVSERKLNMNINCLKLNEEGDMTYLKKDLFIPFLDKQVDNFIRDLHK